MQTYCYLINFDRIISNYHIWWYASMPEVIEHASWNLLMCSLATCAILHHVAIYIIVYIDIDIDIDIYNLIYIYYHTHSIYICYLHLISDTCRASCSWRAPAPCFNRESGNSTAQGGLATEGSGSDWDGIWHPLGLWMCHDVPDFFIGLLG
jgi:hypothetical protein